jgi:ABC-type transport system involved in cytochrome c biogenesis permease subunit
MDGRKLFLLAALTLLPAAVSRAADEPLDLTAWRSMPLFSEGRIMPLDTFARQTVEIVCGQVNPRLTLPDGSTRTYSAAELLLSWLVEPEAWNDVAFLGAEHEALRRDLLEQPIFAPDNRRLKFVTLAQVEQATKFRLRLGDLQEQQAQARKEGKEAEVSGVDRKVEELERAYVTYRQVTFRPTDRLRANRRAVSMLIATVEAWQGLEKDLRQLQEQAALKNSAELVSQTAESMKHLMHESMSESVQPAQIENYLVAVEKSTITLTQQYREALRSLFENPQQLFPEAATWPPQQIDTVRSELKQLVSSLAEVTRLAGETQQALYDSGGSLRLVPALDPGALKSERKNEEAQPWLSLQTVLYGSDTLLAAYPQAELHAVRKAFGEVAAVYVHHSLPDRREKLAAALTDFAAAVRTLGEQIEPRRQNLVDDQQDRDILKLTAYPPPSVTRLELQYNLVDPFYWSWIVNLGALACLGLSFGVLRKPMFWLGVATLAAGQLLTCYGFALRTCVTGWAPVTGMFESVVWVGFVVAMLGLWFTLQPLVWPGLSSMWRLTAVPGTWESAPLTPEQQHLWRPGAWTAGNLLAAGLRLGLMMAVFYVLAVVPYGSDRTTAILSLKPRIDVGSSLPTVMDLITWLVGLAVLATAMWYVPRLVISLVSSVFAVPYALLRQGMGRPVQLTLARKHFALVAAGMAFVIALIAYWSPLWHKDIEALRPVLRDRFWLYIHVLTITASYGAGSLALGLGNIAMGYYLFGHYRDQAIDEAALAALGHRPATSSGVLPVHINSVRRPPEHCLALAGFIYKAMQVAVLLLAAGTILGGLWADVAWGRFWGWDAKEVWALISLLVYLVILHGRYAGWLGNFGLVVGSVLGATAIIGAWWGVNFWLKSGLHSYAQGDGGQIYVFSFLLAEWLFLGAAALRYVTEMSANRPR